MQFKKVEICGFKSFPDAVALQFEPGITAIVGPNGCGKTNVLDAIRWVLGEQSSKLLRGNLMTDLIFNGGSSQKPKGMAEVSLTLVDADGILPTEYSEVTVTRRLFRSGESEYQLNRNVCRLKDIQELFMDTGVGADVYSIIEQSQIDLILSTNPVLRRSLFEEAAGITKYKARKKETMRKLETTEQNLLRLYDIVAEVKRQMNSLKRQAGRAEKYKRFHDECQSLELQLDSFLYYDWEEKHKQYKHSLTNMEDEREAICAKVSTYEAETEKIDLEILQVEDKLASVYESRKSFFQQIENLTKDIAKGNESIVGLENREKVLIREIEEGENKIIKLKEDIEISKEEISVLEGLLAKEKEELAFLEKEMEEISARKKDNEISLRSSEKKFEEIKNKLWIKEKAKEDLEKELKEKEPEKDNNLKTLADIKEKTDYIQSQLNEKRNIVSSGDLKIKELGQKKEKLKQEQAENQAKLREILPRINAAYNKFGEIDYQIKILEQLEREAVGYSQGVKELVSAGKNKEIQNEGFFSPLVSHINTQKEYRTALETALGDGVHYFLTETIDKVKECIEYLYNKDKGKVTFIPLENFVKKEYHRSELSGMPLSGKVQPILDLVETEERLKPVLSFLLNGFFVVDEVPSNSVLRQLPPDVKLVTVKGELFSSELLAGGKSSFEAVSIIGREKNIEDLKHSAGELKKHLDSKTTEKEELEKRNIQIQSTISELDEDTKKHTGSLLEEEKLLMKLDLELNQLNKEKEELDSILKNWEVQLELKFNEGKDIEQEIEKISREKERILSELNELKNQYEIFVEREGNLSKTIVYKKVNLASLEEKKTGKKDLGERLQNMIAALKEEIRAKTNEKDLIVESIEKEKGKLSRNSRELDAIKQEGSNKDFGRDDLESRQKEIRYKWKELEDKLKGERNRLSELDEKISEVKIKEAELRIGENNLKEKMGKIYNLSFSGESFPSKEDINVEEVRPKVEILRKEMDQMGLVNMMALEEYKEVEDRFTFLSTQQKDLEDAKNNLTQTINKINQESEERFKATFQKIRENFVLLFSKFFKEGKADIVLDEKDILESDIEIIAQPPGKKPESIQLLSGGERTLTAIGLLMAIFMVKPSPFLILDEVDAPLDDPNVKRFVDVIREFSHNTQFIVITHNKRTMEMADCLYGVTMEEPGVSKIVSVSFQRKRNNDEVSANL